MRNHRHTAIFLSIFWQYLNYIDGIFIDTSKLQIKSQLGQGARDQAMCDRHVREGGS